MSWTAATFKARWSEFAPTDDAVVQAALDEATRQINAAAFGARADDAIGLLAAHKLAVLAQIAFGVTPDLAAIEKRGIAGLDAMDIRFAAELGYTIKLLAEAWIVPPGMRNCMPGLEGTLWT